MLRFDDASFYYCQNLNPCKKYSGEIVERILPSSVAANAFSYCGTNITDEFSVIGNSTRLNSSCFQYSGLTKLTGTFTYIGASSFNSCTKLQYVDITINGAVDSKAFYLCNFVSHFQLNPSSVITELGNDCFTQLGQQRTLPQNNIFNLDLQHSTISNIPQRAFHKCVYMDIYFPIFTGQIGSSSFNSTNGLSLKFNNITPPVISSTSTFELSQNLNIFVPFESVNIYKEATNWSTQASNIHPWKHFNAGETLTSGYNWYSDIRLTNQVTGTAPSDGDYYGVAI